MPKLIVKNGGNGTATGGGTYSQGAIATLSATADTGYAFKNWELEKGTYITWDGVPESREYVYYLDDTSVKYYKMTSIVPKNINDVIHFRAYERGGEQDDSDTPTLIAEESSCVYNLRGNDNVAYALIVTSDETFVYDDVTYTYKMGVYFLGIDEESWITRYTTAMYINNYLDYTWNGDTTGLSTIMLDFSTFYKVSNDVYSLDNFPSGFIREEVTNNVYTHVSFLNAPVKYSSGTYIYTIQGTWQGIDVPYIVLVLEDDSYTKYGQTLTYTKGTYYRKGFRTSGGVNTYHYPIGMYSPKQIVSTDNPYNFTVQDYDATVTAYFKSLPSIFAQVGEGEGSVYGGGSYAVGDQVTLIAIPDSNYRFLNWKVFNSYELTWDGNTTGLQQFCDTSYYKITDDVTSVHLVLETPSECLSYVDGEEVQYELTNTKFEHGQYIYVSKDEYGYAEIYHVIQDDVIDYGGTTYNVPKGTYVYGYSEDGYTEYVKLVGVCADDRTSTSSTFNFTMDDNQKLALAYFELKNLLTVSIHPTGYGTVTGAGYYETGDTVTLTAIAGSNKQFDSWQVAGQFPFSTDNPLTYTMPSGNTTLYANFSDAPKYRLQLSSSPSDASLYQSDLEAFAGSSVTIKARPLTNYTFVKWSDGDTNAQRTYVMPSHDVSLKAIYKHNKDTEDIYQYRCFVKDQLSLTTKPKAFMVATSFTIRNDLLTKANSVVNVNEIPSNINNGDILVVYSPKGETIYCGVITKVEKKQIQCSQMQHFYAGNWVYNVSPQTYLETEVYNLLSNYTQGKMNGSSYTDSLVATRLGGITLDKTNATQTSLPTKDAKSVMDMETFIYSLYQDYGIILDFNINYSGANTCTIKVPNYTSIKIGNNNNAISNLSPITTIEETNRLIIYGSTGTYRTTYVAKTDGTIVEAPSSTNLRFNVTNTKIVFSDDDASDLVKANLPTQMYNHKVTFELLVKNNLYNYEDFKLGMPLAIYVDGDYFNSILTGWEFTKQDNANLISIKMTCGKVRTSLTNLLQLGKVGG